MIYGITRIFDSGREAQFGKKLKKICDKYAIHCNLQTALNRIVSAEEANEVIADGILNSEKTYQRQEYYRHCSIDFLLIDFESGIPIVAVEFNGEHHNKTFQIEKDKLKERLLRKVDISVIWVACGPYALRPKHALEEIEKILKAATERTAIEGIEKIIKGEIIEKTNEKIEKELNELKENVNEKIDKILKKLWEK